MTAVVFKDATEGHSIVAFTAAVTEAGSNFEDELVPVNAHISGKNSPAVLIDLSAPEYIGSIVLAAIVRLWKLVQQSDDGRLAVVVRSDDHPVKSVLDAAGLTKIWPVVTTHDQAIHELGLSKEAKVEVREQKMSAFVAPIALLAAAVLMTPFFLIQQTFAQNVARYLCLTLSGLSVILSAFTLTREDNRRRGIGIVTLIGAVLITGYMVWVLWARALVVSPPAPGGFNKETEEEVESSPAATGDSEAEDDNGSEQETDEASATESAEKSTSEKADE